MSASSTSTFLLRNAGELRISVSSSDDGAFSSAAASSAAASAWSGDDDCHEVATELVVWTDGGARNASRDAIEERRNSCRIMVMVKDGEDRCT